MSAIQMTFVTRRNLELSAKILIGIILAIFLYLCSLYNYLLFHSIAEIFSIIIAISIFLIAWNSRRITDNDFFIFLGIVFLFIGVIDFIHTLGYPGMNIFLGYGTNLAAQFWILARYLESISFLLATTLLGKRIQNRNRFHYSVIVAYFMICFFLVITIFLGFFPDCFIEGSGLTIFKIVSEYIIIAILFASIISLINKKENLDRNVFQLMIASLSIMMGAEFCFTLYGNDPYGLFNQAGHYLKILSFFIFYNALIVTSLHGSFKTLFKNLHESKEALSESEEKFKDLMASASDSIALWDGDLNLIECNNAILEMLPEGTRKDDIIGRNISEFDPRMIERGEYTQFLEVIKTGKSVTLEGSVLSLKENKRVLLANTFKVGDGLGIITTDITERKKVEDALRESEERLLDFIDSATDSIQLFDSNLNYITVNKAAEKEIGITEEEIIGKSYLEVFPHLEGTERYNAYKEVVRTGKPFFLDGIKHIPRFGDKSYSVKAFKVGDGLGMIVSDVTKRMTIEEALRESEGKYRSLVERASDGIAIVQDYDLVFINQQFAQMLGYTVEELLNSPYKHILPPEVTPDIDIRYKERLEGKNVPSIYETKLMKKGGIPLDVELNVGVIKYQGNLATLTFVRDISERKKIEKEKIDLEKRRLDFISMISHELRTPITVIRGFTEFLNKNLESLDIIRKSQAFQLITQNIIRLERLIEGVADITRLEQGVFELDQQVINFYNFLKDTIQSYKELYGNKFSIHGTMESESPVFLSVDSDRIKQVLDNLLDNAVKQTPDDGKITLTATVLSNTVQICVSDTGVGIDPDDLNRIFEQFVSVTTDRASGGTGIGLYVSKVICHAHGGTISAHSDGKNQGASFVVELPRWYE